MLLGLPTLGLALAITVVSTYLPVLAEDLGSSTTIIDGEGGIFSATDGYAAVWGVGSVSVLLSIPLLRALRRAACAADRRR